MIERAFNLGRADQAIDPRAARPFELDHESFADFAEFLGLAMTRADLEAEFAARVESRPESRFCLPRHCDPPLDTPVENLLRIAMSPDQAPDGETWVGMHLVHDRDPAPAATRAERRAKAPIAHLFTLARRGPVWVVRYRGTPEF
jgi:hypothetical protein